MTVVPEMCLDILNIEFVDGMSLKAFPIVPQQGNQPWVGFKVN